MIHRALCIFLLTVQPAVVLLAADDAQRAADFERRVRSLLIKRCGECHGQDEPENKLTLISVRGIAAGGAAGAVVVPGKPDQSRLIQSVRYNAKLKMPPNRRLAASEIAILEKWVRDGAILPGGSITVRPIPASDDPKITDADRAWWAFQPIRNPAAPTVEHADRVRTAIDRFILRKLEEHNLSLSPDSDRRTLIRRLTFDLIGMPPTPDEVAAFVADDHTDVYERLVERLLASPHYGERWGRHWLDIARYADTNGGGFDYVYPNAWRYRDYVVRALNQDKPYNQFLLEQLAGDLLVRRLQDEGGRMRPQRLKDTGPSVIILPPSSFNPVDALAATGFLTLAPKGLGMQDKEQMALDVVDDQIDVLGRSLLGLTLACARCHDHKFDPIPTEDYYALAGIFRSTVSLIDTNKNPSYWPERPLELPTTTQARNAYKARKAANAKAIAETKKQADAQVAAAAKKRLPEYLLAALQIWRAKEDGPAIAHWTFDDKRGDVIQATVGPSGKLSNAESPELGTKPTRTEGRLGSALRFAGQKEVASIDTAKLTSLDLGTASDFSIGLWLRTAPGYAPKTADTILAARYPKGLWFIALRPGPFNGIYLRQHDGKRSVDVKPASNRLPQLSDGKWHHVVFTSDRDGSGTVYLDGEPAGAVPISSISPAGNFNSAQSFLIGAAHNGFRGDLDDVALWNRLLTPAEIKSLYSQAVDPQLARNVAAVEQARRDRRGADRQQGNSNVNAVTYKTAAERGLIPAVIRKFVTQLAAGESNKTSAFYRLANAAPQNTKVVNELFDPKSTSFETLLKDQKQNPFLAAVGATRFYSDATQQKLTRLNSAAKAIETNRVPDPPLAMIASDAKQPANLKIHIAGDRKNLGEVAKRGFPQILAERIGSGGLRISNTQSGRLELARWLTHPDNPLTARVFVNRVWQWHFGEGLVQTPDNFGRLGERPSHPELLDWLASRLMRDGWSLKQLHRQIVSSSVYRQSSHLKSGDESPQSKDTGNRLLWRMNRRRLEAEALRDAMLSVSGQMDRRIGGTVNTWKAKMFSVDDKNAETANYQTNRRSVYLPIVRGAAVHEMLQLFDFADPNSISARRDVTTVAPQALFLMNSPFVVEQSKRFAARLAVQVEMDDEQRIRLAYNLALSRQPTELELVRSEQFIRLSSMQEGWRLFCQTLYCMNEFAYAD